MRAAASDLLICFATWAVPALTILVFTLRDARRNTYPHLTASEPGDTEE